MNTLKTHSDAQGVYRISLHRPEVRNAFNTELIEELTEVFKKISKDDSIRLVVLEGEGKAFCAGGDITWMKAAVDFSLEENLKDTRELAHMFALINECPKPVIGKIHGAAIGGGVGLVSVCDVVLAEKSTVFSLSEVRLGVIPACIGPFVIAKIGASHSRNLFLSADRFDAERAKQVGLVHETFDGEAALNAAVSQKIYQMLECSPQAVKVAKKLVLDLSQPERRAALKDPLEYVAQTLSQVRVSSEAQEGMRAFLEKRTPSWNKKNLLKK